MIIAPISWSYVTIQWAPYKIFMAIMTHNKSSESFYHCPNLEEPLLVLKYCHLLVVSGCNHQVPLAPGAAMPQLAPTCFLYLNHPPLFHRKLNSFSPSNSSNSTYSGTSLIIDLEHQWAQTLLQLLPSVPPTPRSPHPPTGFFGHMDFRTRMV
jgi:hypothetical protein